MSARTAGAPNDGSWHRYGSWRGRRDRPGEPFPVELSRARFRTLLAGNPNYFGTLKDSQLGELFKAVEEKQSDTRYEEIGCVSYSPELDRLEATIVVKQPVGYSGGPCTTGSVEHVRFFVDFGSGWVDAGVAATRVYDVATNRDCAGDLDHPYVHVVGVVLTPLRKFCASPVLPRVRAILSWEHEPTAGDPGYVPVWGEVQEDHIQIRPRRRFFPVDILDVIGPLVQLDPATHRRPHRHRPAADTDPRAGPRSDRSPSTRSRCHPVPTPTRCRSRWSGSAASTRPTS